MKRKILFIVLFLLSLIAGCSDDNTANVTGSDSGNGAPLVTITAPAQFEFVGDSVHIKIEVLGNSPVNQVILLIDGDSVASDTQSPYEFDWIFSGNNDAHTILAKAMDSQGNTGQSQLVTVYSIIDITAPTVVITNPPTGSILLGNITVKADATDNFGVEEVRFFIDGDSVFSDRNAPYEMQWEFTNQKNSYTIFARATDRQGNTGISSVVTVYSDSLDFSPPVVVITSPANFEIVSDTVTVFTQAIDNVGVDMVEFFINGIIADAVLTAPFNWEWDTTTEPNGFHTILAKAYDAAGNTAISQLINCNVQN